MSDTQKVWVGKSKWNNIYHLNPDCASTKTSDGLKKVNKKRFTNYRCCKRCSGEDKTNHDYSNQDHYKDCPYCGKEIYTLAKHLPKCDET